MSQSRYIFRCPGHPDRRDTQRVMGKINPLVDALRHLQRPTYVRGHSQSWAGSDDDITIWIADEFLGPPTGSGRHYLWMCTRMMMPPWRMLMDYDGVFSASEEHAKFLQAILAGHRIACHLPWPVDVSAPLPTVNTNAAPWVTVWSPSRGDRLDPAAKWVIDRGDNARLFGRGWARWGGTSQGQPPANMDEFCEILAQGRAYVSIDLLRNLSTGFVDAFALYAILSGRPVYSDQRAFVPPALAGCFRTLRKNTGDCTAPTPDALAQAQDWIAQHHNSLMLAQRLVDVTRVERAGDSGFLVAKNLPQPTPLPDPVILCEDPDEQTDGLTLDQIKAALENGLRPNVMYVPALPHFAKRSSGVFSMWDLQKMARGRLERMCFIAENHHSFADFSVAAFQDLRDMGAYRHLPVHDLTHVLTQLRDTIVQGDFTAARPLVDQAKTDLETLVCDNTPPRECPSQFKHPWPNIFDHMTDTTRCAEYVSKRLNSFDHLQDTKDMRGAAAVIKPQDTPVQMARPIGVFVHIYYPDLAVEILSALANITYPKALYISTDQDEKALEIAKHVDVAGTQDVTIRVIKNRGRDIYPKLVGFADAYANHDIVLHMHSKKSLHSRMLSDWRAGIFTSLLGSPQQVHAIMAAFQGDQKLDLVFPDAPAKLQDSFRWMRNLRVAEYLCAPLNLDLPSQTDLFDFPAGSMFWARSDIFKDLLEMVDLDDFPPEVGQEDGTTSHALERIFGLLARKKLKLALSA